MPQVVALGLRLTGLKGIGFGFRFRVWGLG